VSDSRPRNQDSSADVSTTRHGRLKRPTALGGVFGLIGVVIAVIAVSALAIAGIAIVQLEANIAPSVNINPSGSVAPPPNIGVYPGGFNILIVGDDTRAGQGDIGGGIQADGGALNDVTILLHVSANHQWATAISFARDMIIPHVQCQYGGTGAGLPVNTALSYGGLPCVVTQIEAFTGLPIQFAGLITFTGVIDMSDAVGGVDVCTTGPMIDNYSGLDLTTGGDHLLTGETALEFLRSRHGVGDGSDLGRISSQQVYLSSLVRKLESSGTLGNPLTVYKIASAATQNMQLSSSLDSIPTMISIASALKGISPSNIQFVQYPGTTGGTGIYAGKVQPELSIGDKLINQVKEDQPFTIGTQGDNRGSVVESTGTSGKALAGTTVINGLVGQSAAEVTCSKARPLHDQ
jgi:LCP family protein required for cell wall assembly